MPRRNTVLVAPTSMSRLYLVDLVRELAREPRAITVIAYFRSPLFDEAALGAMRDAGATVHQFAPRSYIQHVKARHDAYRLVRRVLQNGPTDLFHVHPTHFLTNWISFDVEQRRALDVHFNLIPDGLANYYVARVAAHDKPDLPRRLVNAVAGVRYYPNDGTILGLGYLPYENYWYAGSPGIMGEFMPTRRFEVSRPGLVEPERPDSLLFFGQPRANAAGEAAYRMLLEEVAQRGHRDLQYKPHPIESLTPEFLGFLRRLGIELTTSTMPAEQLALSYSAVAGALSSAQVNLLSLGWHDTVYGVTDPEALSDLTGRSLDEARQMSEAAVRLGILPIGLPSRAESGGTD